MAREASVFAWKCAAQGCYLPGGYEGLGLVYGLASSICGFVCRSPGVTAGNDYNLGSQCPAFIFLMLSLGQGQGLLSSLGLGMTMQWSLSQVMLALVKVWKCYLFGASWIPGKSQAASFAPVATIRSF